MKITIVAGARPNFMKIAPITRAIEAARALGKSISYRLVYTGRKDDTSLDASLFSDLDMKAPDVYLGVESSNPTSLTAGIMIAFEQELTENPAHVVLVVDDLTATMSCAIVAKKQGIKVAHLVAGTRSFDMKMPKEVNRMITDGVSDYLFTAGMVANRNLNQTGTESENVYYVGNILVDTVRFNRNRLLKPVWCSVLGLQEGNYLLLTLNRRVLLNNKENLRQLLKTIIEKICRYAYRSTAAHIRTKCHQRIRHRSSEPPHNAATELPVLRLSDKQGKRNHYGFGQRGRRSNIYGYSMYHAQHVCRTSRNMAHGNQRTCRGRSCPACQSNGHPDAR